MILINVAIALVLLALITRLGVVAIERMYPRSGQIIDVNGARLRVVDIGPCDGSDRGLPLVLIHGASSNLESMRQPLGEKLAQKHRVILIDRPGHGWSTRERLTDSTPAIQAAMIDEALGKLGIDRAIFVVHSWAGALGPAMAIAHAERVAGLVMLAPVTHPWPGGVAWYNYLATMPVVGFLFTRLFAMPAGLILMTASARSAFLPQIMPLHYVRDTGIALLMRPLEFVTNAYDMVTLKAAVAVQARDYEKIKAPAVVISGDAEDTVSIQIHSYAFVKAVPNAKLIVLPNVGHMTQNSAPDVIADEIDRMVSDIEALSPIQADQKRMQLS
jgi:pimeloyl-ACP methyl ester carboxylesterase